MNQNQPKTPAFERLTNSERDQIIARDFRGDEDLAMAFGCYYRAQVSGRDFSDRDPVPECSSTAWEELADGTVRRFACLADYEGLVAVYRVCTDGRLVRLEAWPQWLVGLDRDPEWRAACRRLQTNKRRRQRRARTRIDLLVAKLMAAKPAPVAEAIADTRQEDENEKALREALARLAAKKAAKAASRAAATAQAAAVTTPTPPPTATEGQLCGEIDMADLDATLAKLDGLAA